MIVGFQTIALLVRVSRFLPWSLMWWFPRVSSRALPSTRRCLATIKQSRSCDAASSSVSSARLSPKKRQRLLEPRHRIDKEKDAQLRLKRDKEEHERRLRRFDMSWIKDALLGVKIPPKHGSGACSASNYPRHQIQRWLCKRASRHELPLYPRSECSSHHERSHTRHA